MASLTALAPLSPWCTDSAAIALFEARTPPLPVIRTAVREKASPRPTISSNAPVPTIATAATRTRRLPKRRMRGSPKAPATKAPAARAVPCSPATALLVPSSTRNRGTDGPKE